MAAAVRLESGAYNTAAKCRWAESGTQRVFSGTSPRALYFADCSCAPAGPRPWLYSGSQPFSTPGQFCELPEGILTKFLRQNGSFCLQPKSLVYKEHKIQFFKKCNFLGSEAISNIKTRPKCLEIASFFLYLTLLTVLSHIYVSVCINNFTIITNVYK